MTRRRYETGFAGGVDSGDIVRLKAELDELGLWLGGWMDVVGDAAAAGDRGVEGGFGLGGGFRFSAYGHRPGFQMASVELTLNTR